MPVRLTILPPRASKPRVVEFDDACVTIGRSSRCDIRLPFRIVSGHHLTLTRSPGGLQVRDEHSTNGTLLDGQPLVAGAERQLVWGATLKIADLSIEVELIPDLNAHTSLEQTGTMARQMLEEALVNSSDDEELESAYFEVVSGPSKGRVATVPDDLERESIADDEDALIRLDGLRVVLEVFRDGDGFGLGLGRSVVPDTPVLLNGAPLLEEHHLSSGDLIECDNLALRFTDPLEAYLDELDGVGACAQPPGNADGEMPTEPEAGVAPSCEESRETSPLAEETDNAKNPDFSARSWSTLEIGVLAASIVVLSGVFYLLLSIFGLI